MLNRLKWPAKDIRFFALTGDTSASLLTELISVPQRRPKLKVVSLAEGSAVLDKANLKQLLTQSSESLAGDLSIALPLSFFEIINLTLPVMPKEAVGQAMPYHLAKNINQPLDEYVYDWQITRHDKERLRITAYLFPAATFDRIQSELAKKKLAVTFFESDVFAAFAFLDLQERLKNKGATLCILIWKNSLSLAIYENRALSLVRTVPLNQPDITYSATEDRGAEPVSDTLEVATASKSDLEEVLYNPTAPSEDYIDETTVNSILENFALLGKESTTDSPVPDKAPADVVRAEIEMNPLPENPPPTKQSGSVWSDYIKQINLEVVRTKDYYLSVIQGPAIQQVFVGGADEFIAELQDLIIGKNVIKFEALATPEEATECSPLLNAISIGTGARR